MRRTELMLDIQNMRVGLVYLDTGEIIYRNFDLEFPMEYWQRAVEDQERWKREREKR